MPGFIQVICTICKNTFTRCQESLDTSASCNDCLTKGSILKKPTPAQLDNEEMEFIFREDQRNDFLSMGDM